MQRHVRVTWPLIVSISEMALVEGARIASPIKSGSGGKAMFERIEGELLDGVTVNFVDPGRCGLTNDHM
jgi:hypothetical protein